MQIEVVLPKVDMDMESGVIAEWKVAEGDFVHEGDTVFAMDTDKAVMEVEAPATGTIRGLARVTGEPVAVGTIVAWIDTEGEAAPAREAPGAAALASRIIAPVEVRASVRARPVASSASAEPTGDGIRASPLARRAAKSRGIDLRAVQGSGPRGRIVAGDVEAHGAAAHPSPDSARAATSPKRDAEGHLVPFTTARRIAALRLSESVRTAPHFYLSAQVEMTALRDALKSHAKAAGTVGVKPSLTVAIAFIAARVLVRHPILNASVEDDAVRMHDSVHIGIAMDRDGELLVPVLRDAAVRTLSELTQEFGRLRDAVRSRSIAAFDMRGATFSISNLGMYGVDAFTAIIDPPQSAILAVGRTQDTPVGRDGQIVLRPMATFSLSSDHRIVDGVAAARFMADLREAIERPENLL